MRVCQACERNYIYEPEIAQVGLAQYAAKRLPLSINSQDIDALRGEVKKTKNAATKSKKQKNKQKSESNQPQQYVFRYGAYHVNSSVSQSTCRWAGCHDKVFRDGLCWEHYQHELGEN